MPATKPPCLGKIKEMRRGFNQFEMILAMILYETLQREIGLNLSKEEDPLYFGRRDKKDELVAPPKR
jgi:hypothetical protein